MYHKDVLYLKEYTGNRLGHIVKVGQIVYNYVIKRYYGKNLVNVNNVKLCN